MSEVALGLEFIPTRRKSRAAAVIVGALALLVLQACSLPERLNAVPKDIEAQAEIPGMPGVRYWQAGDLERLDAVLAQDRGLVEFARAQSPIFYRDWRRISPPPKR